MPNTVTHNTVTPNTVTPIDEATEEQQTVE